MADKKLTFTTAGTKVEITDHLGRIEIWITDYSKGNISSITISQPQQLRDLRNFFKEEEPKDAP